MLQEVLDPGAEGLQQLLHQDPPGQPGPELAPAALRSRDVPACSGLSTPCRTAQC